MKKINELVEKYPIFFEHLKEEGNDILPAYMFGIECGEGWYDLLDKLMSHLSFNIKHNRVPQINVTQIKEKFGGLCFYYDGGNDYARGMIRFAEAMSYGICEDCGSNHNVTKTKEGWITCLCEKCMEKYNESKGKI